MALVEIPGQTGFSYPAWPASGQGQGASAPTTYVNMLIDAATEIASFNGRVFFTGRSGSKNIQTVTLGFGAVTPSTGSSTVRVSLQDPSTTAGGPMQPDGVVDQSWTATITNIVANAVATMTMSATRTVNFGDLLSVVVDYSTFSGTPALNVRGAGNTFGQHAGTASLKASGTWTSQSMALAVILGFDDGTYGCLAAYDWPVVSWGTISYNNGSASDEYGNQFTVSNLCCADGIWAILYIPAGGTANCDVVLYEGAAASSVAIASCQVDANWTATASNYRVSHFMFSAIVTLTTTSTYWVSVKPTTATNIQVVRCTVVNATQLSAYPGGVNVVGCSRVDAGTWTTTATERTFCGITISHVDNGASAAAMVGGIFSGGVFS